MNDATVSSSSLYTQRINFHTFDWREKGGAEEPTELGGFLVSARGCRT